MELTYDLVSDFETYLEKISKEELSEMLDKYQNMNNCGPTVQDFFFSQKVYEHQFYGETDPHKIIEKYEFTNKQLIEPGLESGLFYFYN